MPEHEQPVRTLVRNALHAMRTMSRMKSLELGHMRERGWHVLEAGVRPGEFLQGLRRYQPDAKVQS